MSKLSVADKAFLEAVLGMSGGYVLDLTDGSFNNLFAEIDIDIYDNERYSDFGRSKANRLRALWKHGTDQEVADSVTALADYIEGKKIAGSLNPDVTDDQLRNIRGRGQKLRDDSSTLPGGAPVPITTEATVTSNRISIEIHEDIYSHIQSYLEVGDHFHAVAEAYKVVREKLRALTGSEKATDVFNPNAQNVKHYSVLFGKVRGDSDAEADFFRGVGYLHLGVQFLRNQTAHSLATPLEPNLAVHYLSLASLSYDLITRYVSDETVAQIEQLVRDKHASYRTVRAFYRDFDSHKWLEGLELPPSIKSTSVRKALKCKWLGEADFTKSWDHSNIVLMRLQLVIDELTSEDIDFLLGLPTEDSYGNDQLAGMQQFLSFVEGNDATKLSARARQRMAEFEAA